MNRYGYSPLSLEWDLWLDPAAPAELAGANVDHGSPLHLVQQVGERPRERHKEREREREGAVCPLVIQR